MCSIKFRVGLAQHTKCSMAFTRAKYKCKQITLTLTIKLAQQLFRPKALQVRLKQHNKFHKTLSQSSVNYYQANALTLKVLGKKNRTTKGKMGERLKGWATKKQNKTNLREKFQKTNAVNQTKTKLAKL